MKAVLETAPPNERAGNQRGPVLVTGATGFTGGHLARALRSRGYAVRALARRGADVRKLTAQGISIYEGDLRDARAVDRAVAGTTAVYHIAAVYRSAKHPDSYYRDVNVEGTRHVLHAARRHQVGRVVHCSTVGVHGETLEVPADELAPLAPGDIYQQTKLEAEQLACEAFSHDLNGVVFRPVGIYGPGDLRFLKLFKTIHTRTFRMFGSGEVLYHLTYIDDLVDGIVRCGERAEAVGQTYILAGPQYTTLNELVSLVADAVGVAPPRGRLPAAPLVAAATLCELTCRLLRVEPPLHRRRIDFFLKDRAFSYRKAEQDLGYVPVVSLAEGLGQTARWYFEQGHLANRRPSSSSTEALAAAAAKSLNEERDPPSPRGE